MDCEQYVRFSLCRDGAVQQNWAVTAEFNFPATHCCACGGGQLRDGVSAAPSFESMPSPEDDDLYRHMAECLEHQRTLTEHPIPAKKATLPWFAAWKRTYRLLERTADYENGFFGILDTQFVGTSRSHDILDLFEASHLDIVDPCHAVRIMGHYDLGRMAVWMKHNPHNCSGCCSDVAAQRPGGGYSIIIGRGSLQIGDCSPALQDGGFFVAENVTKAIFDGVAQPAVQRIQAAAARCEFRSVTATVRMLVVEKCVSAGTIRPSSPRARQFARVDTLRLFVNGMLESERKIEPNGSALDSLLNGLTLLLGTDFAEQPLRVLLLRTSTTDACVWIGLFASAHIVISAGTDEVHRNCSSASSARVESWQQTAEAFDVVVDMGGEFGLGPSDTGSHSGSLMDGLSRVKLGGWFVAMSPWAEASGPNFLQIFAHLAMLLAAEALPQELSDVLSIHLYSGSAFMQKACSARFRAQTRSSSMHVLCQISAEDKPVPAEPVGSNPPIPWLQKVRRTL